MSDPARIALATRLWLTEPQVAAGLLEPDMSTEDARRSRELLLGVMASRRGAELVGRGRGDDAESVLAQAATMLDRVHGGAAEVARVRLATVLVSRGDVAEAEQVWSEGIAATHDPGLRSRYAAQAALCRLRAGRPEGAVEAIEEARASLDDVSLRLVWSALLVDALVADREVARAIEEAARVVEAARAGSDEADELAPAFAVRAATAASVGAAFAGDAATAAALLHQATRSVPSDGLTRPAVTAMSAFVSASSYPGGAPSDPGRAGGPWNAWVPEIRRAPDVIADHVSAVVASALQASATARFPMLQQQGRLHHVAGRSGAALDVVVVAEREAGSPRDTAAIARDACIYHQGAGDDEAALRRIDDALGHRGAIWRRSLPAYLHERAAILARLGHSAQASDAYTEAKAMHLAVGQVGDAADCTMNLDVLAGRDPSQRGRTFVSGTLAMCWPDWSATSSVV